jgi:TonB-linked SusC/RagA family outer membrane protein
MQFSFAQDRTVTGVVSDNSGSLPGVNVVVQGTKTGTQTDIDGKFAIKAKTGDVLVFSYVGMPNSTVKVGASSSYKVSMNSSVLETVVVTGAMGIQKKKEALTSSQQVVGSKELTQAANPNAIRSLTGKVSGVQINNTSNGVNGSTRIVIRGSKSLYSDNAALVVIDGAISDAATLNAMPADILDSVNVIKGAQGAALYGAQGANGVIVVQTKKGQKTGKVKIGFNSAIDFESVSFVPKKQGKYGQGWAGAWDPFENGGWGELADGSIRPVGLPQADGTQFTAPYSEVKDNVKQFYKSGTIIQNGVSLEVGGESGYATFTANNQQNEFINDGDYLKRNTFMFKGGQRFGKFSVDGIVNYTNSKTSQADADEILPELLQGASTIPFGLFANSGGLSGWNVYYDNPYWKRKNNRFDQINDGYNLNALLAYKINDHITIDYRGNLRTSNTNQQTHRNQLDDNTPESSANGSDRSQISQFYQSNGFSRDYYGDLMAHFKYKLTENLGLSFDLGQNLQDRYTNRQSQGGKNLDIPGWYHVANVLNPDNARDLRNSSTRLKTVAHFVNVDLSYKDYLYFNGTLRNESTSALPKQNRNYTYYSGGVSFIPTKAIEGLSNSKFLSSSKILASYTRVGSALAIQAYSTQFVDGVASGFPFPNTGNSYTDFTSITNVNIKPEFYTTLEAGINLGFFKDRLTLEAAIYNTKTTDLINNNSASYSSGITNLLTNVGDLENKGVEVDLGFTPFKSESFEWSGRLSYTAYDTKVKALGNNPTAELYDVGALNNMTGGISANVGSSFPALMGTTWVRDNEGRVIVGPNGLPTSTNTYSVLGKATPDYILNYTNNINYKGFGLVFTLDYRTGHQFFSESKYNLSWNGHLEETADFDRDLGFIFPNSVINTGTIANPVYTPNSTVYTAPGHGSNGVETYYNLFSQNGESMVVDATAFKVREISLSYSLPKKFTEKLNISNLRFSVNARNAFVILAKSNRGFADPEASNTYDASTQNASTRITTAQNTASNAQGYVQTGQYPSTKTIGFALNVSF